MIDGRLELARTASTDGLIEEAIREWQLVKRDDPSNEEALKALASAGKPYVREWSEETHRKFLAWSDKRRAFLGDAARKWAAVATEREKAGDRDGSWEACQRAFGCDPECATAHSLLGEAKYDGNWVTEEVAAKRGKGLLELRGEWLPAADVRKQRTNWDDAWELDGAHYHVKSNRGYGSARTVLARSEEVYAAFFREIIGVVDPPPLKKRLLVLEFAKTADVEAHLKALHGGGTTPKNVPGWYTPSEAVHLVDLPEGSVLSREEVALHECSHAAASDAIELIGWANTRPHFWVWEGVASYFESTVVRDGKILTGGTGNARLRLAKDELKEGKFTPLEKFVQLNQDGLGRQYQQAAGLVHFFLHAKNGKYREAFIAYFRAVAAGEAKEDAFDKAFGRSAESFEPEWKEHVLSFK